MASTARLHPKPEDATPELSEADAEAAERARLRLIGDTGGREHCRRCLEPVLRRSDFGWYCAACLDNAAEAADSWGETGPAWFRRFESSLGALDWREPSPAPVRGARRR